MTQKSVGLYRDRQKLAFQEAADAVADEHDVEPSDGAVVRKLAEAYVGFDYDELSDDEVAELLEV